MTMHWGGVIPAITTPFLEDLTVDHEFLARHCGWLIDNGCAGVESIRLPVFPARIASLISETSPSEKGFPV